MAWETLFNLANGWAIIGWLALAFLPRDPRILALILYLGVALLCLVYTVALVAILAGGVDPVGPTGGDFSTLAGVMTLFDSKGGAVIGWTHYLAFDLFVGMWIARDADQKGFSRAAQLPFLLFTFFLGPVGLLGWLVIRDRRARAQAKTKAAGKAA
ncbi:ABA4-like family protein [Sphingopyxis sp. MWB1]|uniref:ABA4-like family protein n=1 Tax=Sphingopyxis sp. MWB1 TaxID=1537715 RepID=UPI000519F159|nr:ABA4-like family protein [Sphingopyxis sp. MWB1]